MDERLKSWIVKILPSEDADIAQGTGFWAAEGGYVLTCTHVVEGMNLPWIEYNDQKAAAEIVSQEGDVTLLKVQGLSGESAPLGTEWQREDKIDSLGYQYEGVDPRIGYFPIEGTISGSSELDSTGRITLKEAIHVKPGASGAPALNRRTGKVIGIISDKWEQQQVAFVLPLSKVLKQWDVLKKAVEKIEVEPLKNAICQFLETIKNEFKYVPIFHPPHKIVLQDQYIPIEVTLERRYRHAVETTWSYAEGEAEFARAYAMKGFEEQQEETRRVQVPWQEAKKQHKRLIVLADPGMGKTALLKMEAVTTAQKVMSNDGTTNTPVTLSEVEVPLFFRLSEFADTDEEIADTIPRLLQRNYPDTAPTILPLLAEKLKNGTCLLLLDALDEVPQEQRNPLAEKLNRFARNYPCPIIVTSRIVGYGGGILHDAKEVEIVPFTRKQVEQYIEIWFKNLELDKMNRINRIEEDQNNPVNPVHPVKNPDLKGLIHELQQKPQIRGLAQKPLLLSLLCSLYQEDELTLPARRVQIYEQAVHYMLYDWRRVSQRRLTEQALTDEAWIEAKLELLEHLAYQFSCEYKKMFSMRELLTKIEECKGGTALKHHDTPDIIKELSQEDGIIQQLDGQGHKTRYIFLHRTFQEYLTASYLNRQPNAIELAKTHFWDFDWHETIVVFTGLLDDPIPLLKTITNEKDDIFSTLLLLAGKCIAECEEQDNPFIKQIITNIFAFWHSYSGLQFIGTTVASILQAHRQFLEDFKRHIYDNQRQMVMGAINVLGRIANRQATQILIQSLNNPNSPYIQGLILQVLNRIELPEAIEALNQYLEFLRADLNSQDIKIREKAIWRLGDIGTPKAIEVLQQILDDDSEHIQTIAVTVLGQIGNHEAIQILSQAIEHKSEYVSRLAINALGKIGNEEALQVLTQACNHKNHVIGMVSLFALSEITNSKAVEILAQTLNRHDENIRLAAINSLGRIEHQEALKALIQAFNHSDQKVRMQAVLTLRLLSSSDAKIALEQAYRHNDDLVRHIAEMDLKEFDSQLIKTSKQLLLRQEQKPQKIASELVEKYGEEETIVILAASLDNENQNVRLTTIGVLQALGTPEAVNILPKAFQDTDDIVCVTAIDALKEIALQHKEPMSQQAINILQRAIIHENHTVRMIAAGAFEKLRSIESLRLFIEHPNINIYDPINLAVSRTLAIHFSMESSSLIPVYPELLSHKSPEYRVRPDLRKSKRET